MEKKQLIAIIGGGVATCTQEDLVIAFEIGKLLVENNFRIICGGKGGVMEAVCRGAKSALNTKEGDTLCIIPSFDKSEANQYCDIIITSGIGYARNQIIVASADAIVAIGGGSGTLSEIAFAWQLGKPIFAFTSAGWSKELAGKKLDKKRDDVIIEVKRISDLLPLMEKKMKFNL